MSDASLKAQIEKDRAQKEKYERVRASIQSHGFHSDVNLKFYEDYADLCTKVIDKIDGNEGYHYLSTLKEKLAADKKTVKEYVQFVKDANTSYKRLYTLLGRKITVLDTRINQNKATYNEGKMFWEWIW